MNRTISPSDAADLALDTLKRLGAAMHAAGVAYYRWDLRHDIVDWSAEAENAFPLLVTRCRSIGDPMAVSGAHTSNRNRLEFTENARNGRLHASARMRSEFFVSDGLQAARWFEEQMIFDPHCDLGVAPTPTIIAIVRDITDQRAELSYLTRLASTDGLTGELNREALKNSVERLLSKRRSSNIEFGYLLIGVDGVDRINEAYGYDVADEVIAQIGGRLRENLRPYDVIGRFSGPKFGVLLPRCDRAGVDHAASRLRRIIREHVISTRSGPVATTVSIGCVVVDGQDISAQDLFVAGEESLEMAQQRQFDGQCVFEIDLERLARRQESIAIAQSVFSGLTDGRLTLAYQPVVLAEDPGRVAFYECLVRLRDGHGGLTPAYLFMPIAEKLGLVRMIDRLVLQMAFATLRRVPDVRLSVNLSPQSAMDETWRELFRFLMKSNPHLAERLIFEITEASAIEDTLEITMLIKELRDEGSAIALDDFGAGYSSFRYLKDLHLDIVKIDGSFIKNIANSSEDQMFVKALVDISKHFDMMCVAEFVDNEEAAEFLRGLGVDCFQGYHFGKPTIDPEWLNGAAPTSADARLSAPNLTDPVVAAG